MTKQEKLEANIEKYCHWHKWFAWYPVTILHPTTGVTYRAWLETVGRKMIVYSSCGDMYQRIDTVGSPDYCFKEDLLVNTLQDNDIIDKRDR